MIKVYSSPYIADCDQLRMSLSSAGIPSEMRNEFGHPIGLAALGGAAGFAAPEVWVDDADRALSLTTHHLQLTPDHSPLTSYFLLRPSTRPYPKC